MLRLLNYEDEVFAVVSLLLERHSLSTMHATFAESLYGLKRQPAAAAHSAVPAGSSSSNNGSLQEPGTSPAVALLSKKQQYQALMCEVGLPYLSSELLPAANWIRA